MISMLLGELVIETGLSSSVSHERLIFSDLLRFGFVSDAGWV